ncbi:response regulator transcription factor [Nonomuraea ferruginea]
MEVVAAVADGADAVSEARRLRPDVCLLDIRMPRLDGLEATRALAGPGVENPMRVVIVTTFDLDEYVYGALRAGATGFLLKDSGPTLLVEAVKAAAGGESLVSPSVTVRLLRHLSGPRRSPAPLPEPLTDRELDVVRLVARGRTNQEVAAELFVSLSTVKTHLGSIFTKLGTRNRVEIAAWAWESGVVS